MPCHICGQSHKMVMTPFPLETAGNGYNFCPYDPEGKAKFKFTGTYGYGIAGQVEEWHKETVDGQEIKVIDKFKPVSVSLLTPQKENEMDEVFITALVNQALQAYQQGGQPALDQWKRNLPPPHLTAFDQHCTGPLNEAIAALGEPAEPKEDAPADPRKQHRSDPRRTRPI